MQSLLSQPVILLQFHVLLPEGFYLGSCRCNLDFVLVQLSLCLLPLGFRFLKPLLKTLKKYLAFSF